MVTHASPRISCSEGQREREREGGNILLIFLILTSDSSARTRLLHHSATSFSLAAEFLIRQSESKINHKTRIENVQTGVGSCSTCRPLRDARRKCCSERRKTLTRCFAPAGLHINLMQQVCKRPLLVNLQRNTLQFYSRDA